MDGDVQLINAVSRQQWELDHEQISLNKLIGEGECGAVFSGFLCRNGSKTEVAIKVQKGKACNKEVIESICNEARILRKIEHKNIVKLYGIAAAKQPIMLLMEYLKDGCLDAFLAVKGSSLSELDKLNMCLDVASGLEFLHQNNYIHRDVAARNCLVGDKRVRISTFRLSREISAHDKKYKIHNLKQKLPIRWLAPEILKNAIYTTKSDVFSYGILLWEVFTDGAEPYSGMTVAEVNDKVKTGYRMPPPECMPPAVQQIQHKCFQTDAQDRWPMFEIRARIQEAIA